MSDRTHSSHLPDSGWSYCFPHLSEAASSALAADIACLVQQGDILALDGDLGLGKSTFARALLRARAENPDLEVPSPTFTLVQTYDFPNEDADLEISHFDLYRIGDFEELFEIGLEDSWQSGCALIEWPDRAEELLPEQSLWLRFENGADSQSRKLTLFGDCSWGERLQRMCQKRQLLIDCGWEDGIRAPIKGDLSPRNYDRVHRPDEPPKKISTSAILMDMPERQPGPVLSDGRLYDHVAHRVTKLAPMICTREGLQKLGLKVPEVYGFALQEGLALWEDFGAQTLTEGPDKPVEERYLATVSALADLHNQPLPDAFETTAGRHELSHYDEDAFGVELDVFVDFFWPHVKMASCPPALRAEFHQLWRPLLTHLTASEQVLVLRDVQDPNCFWLDVTTRKGPVGFIDFQDCLIGPSAYDLAALAMDARVTIPVHLAEKMVTAYKSKRDLNAEASAAFDAAFCLCACQRTMKNLGAFARAADQAGRPDYLDHIPRSLDYLTRAMTHPLLSELKDWYGSQDFPI
ncbi:tRNA (adenosine(37)-N6)-threonylcarbamoyltransferase complex ATPase subunit type 1 TsaE [Cohaesibacter celericrescens]|uniref:tRNA threonylcarbamoyladenosine biosynthesis protein TsaE n=1 Tax=Cohaesibacter celericrescens TaxID=2067669 RepID=A0A2N5XMW0_9HYPH|nr:tRNA (adenosine(37)-N6)-threonylcarbamoyltransferase complex ATPase subunit type 1 TsaE [Cohaesibacter celericrescens]PLW75886.1 tRNA (adenosine(37)-N6)-threonylcarbamoyltransferase complex ATPase subunit type 1 TsaE [Cohaesibacter celericrescens]